MNHVHDLVLILYVSLCVRFFKICAKLYCTIISGKRKYSEVVLFSPVSSLWGKVRFIWNVSHMHVSTCTHTPCGPPLPGWNSKLLQLLQSHNNSHRAQEIELLLLASFLPVTIKYVLIRQGNRDLQQARISQRNNRRTSYLGTLLNAETQLFHI